MERYAFALALASTGCHLVFALEDPPRDAAVGGELPGTCYGTGDLVACPQVPLPTTSTLPPAILTDGAACLLLDPPSTPGICVVGALAFESSSLRAQGMRPLVIIGDVVTLGTVDVSSGPGNVVGAGARSSCPAFAGAPSAMAGAAGGSHGASGGSGGTNGSGQPGGQPGATPVPEVLLGGCAGQQNGLARGGAGGGAVAVLARTRLTIDGSIDASGAGGDGAAATGGGAGGGAGGMIYLDAPNITLGPDAQIFANGGGGGEGGEVGSPGMPGLESVNPTNPGFGGTGGGAGADGGDGGLGTTAAEMGANAGAGLGGGGGGGAIGVIRMLPNPVGNAGNVSPPATP